MSSPDFSNFKKTYLSAWKQVFQRLEALESENGKLQQRIEKLEKGQAQ